MVRSDQIRIWTEPSSDITGAIIYTRGDGVISHAKLRVHATNFADAEGKTQEIVGGVLSFLSVFSGYPVDVKITELYEETTDSIHWTFTAIGGYVATIGWDQMPDMNLTSLKDGLRTAFANFRDGMNSLNSFYKFLCFYKVAEYCVARKKQDARKNRKAAVEPEPTIPESMEGIASEDAVLLQPHSGKTYSSVLGTYKNVLRNAIAHLTPGVQGIDPDNLRDLRACEDTVPVIQYIARSMLQARYTSEVIGSS